MAVLTEQPNLKIKPSRPVGAGLDRATESNPSKYNQPNSEVYGPRYQDEPSDTTEEEDDDESWINQSERKIKHYDDVQEEFPASSLHGQAQDLIKKAAKKRAVNLAYTESWLYAPVINTFFWVGYMVVGAFMSESAVKLLSKKWKILSVVVVILTILAVLLLIYFLMSQFCTSFYGIGAKVAGFLQGEDVSFCEIFKTTN